MRRAGYVFFGTAVVITLLATACARRPSVSQATAPSPPGPVASAPVTPAAAPSVVAAPAPATPARPSPNDFGPVAKLPDIYFDFDKYAIRPDAAQVLQESATWLNTHAGHAVIIEAHCDERGTSEYNLALGDRRARATRDFLEAHGVAARRISMLSYGEERPQCTEHNEECWSRNRRSRFLVKPE